MVWSRAGTPSPLARYLTAEMSAALARSTVFIGGPRQVGKTTVALSLLASDATEQHRADLNWDDPAVPPRLRSGRLPPGEPLVILHEIHK